MRTYCEIHTEIDWAVPDVAAVSSRRGAGSDRAWRGIADAPEYRRLPPREVRDLVSLIDLPALERSARVFSGEESETPTGRRFIISDRNVLWGPSGPWRRWDCRRPGVYYSPVKDLLAAAAKMRPDLFPFQG
jgi:hypothetical protein